MATTPPPRTLGSTETADTTAISLSPRQTSSKSPTALDSAASREAESTQSAADDDGTPTSSQVAAGAVRLILGLVGMGLAIALIPRLGIWAQEAGYVVVFLPFMLVMMVLGALVTTGAKPVLSWLMAGGGQ